MIFFRHGQLAIAIDQVRYKALKLAAAKSELQLQHHVMYKREERDTKLGRRQKRTRKRELWGGSPGLCWSDSYTASTLS